MTDETLSTPICFRYYCEEDIVILSGQTVNISGDDVKIHDIAYPKTDGTFGQSVTTDGSGNLSFTTVAGGGGGTSIFDTDAATRVETERTADDDTIRLRAAGTDVQTITETLTTIDNPVTITGKITTDDTATHILNQLHVDGKMEISVTNTTSTSYVVGDTEYLIEWNGLADGTITLPSIGTNTGRRLIVYNLSNTKKVSITPSSGDTIEAKVNPIELEDKYEHAQFQADSGTNWMLV